jgi:hypothetical protein
MVLTNSFIAAIIKIQRALPVDGWPQTLSYEVTAGLAAGRLLLFINVNHKVNHHDNQHTELNKIRPVEIHKYHPPFSGSGGHQYEAALRVLGEKEGQPPTVTGSAKSTLT